MLITKKDIISKAKEYCKRNKLSIQKLDNQEIYKVEDVFFAQPITPKYSDGLRTDLDSQPKPTLIYRIVSGEFEETEYTDKYLR